VRLIRMECGQGRNDSTDGGGVRVGGQQFGLVFSGQASR